jgi:hypothetical protein
VLGFADKTRLLTAIQRGRAMTVRDTIPSDTREAAAMVDRRWVAADFGGLEVLKQVDVEVPAPGPAR